MVHKRKKEVVKEKEIPAETEVRLSIAERELLREMAGNISPQHVVVEIANNICESTEALASGAQQVGVRVFNLTLYAKVDSEKKVDDVRFKGVVSETERVNGVTVLNGSTYDLSRRWKEAIALLVVTGYAQYEEVREAVICWQEHLSPEAVIVVHNCFNPGPAQAIKELLADGGNFIIQRTVDNMVVLAIDDCRHYWMINSREIGVCRHCGRERNFKKIMKEADVVGVRRKQTAKSPNKESQTKNKEK